LVTRNSDNHHISNTEPRPVRYLLEKNFPVYFNSIAVFLMPRRRQLFVEIAEWRGLVPARPAVKNSCHCETVALVQKASKSAGRLVFLQRMGKETPKLWDGLAVVCNRRNAL
jgi:hypothetical protein